MNACDTCMKQPCMCLPRACLACGQHICVCRCFRCSQEPCLCSPWACLLCGRDPCVCSQLGLGSANRQVNSSVVSTGVQPATVSPLAQGQIANMPARVGAERKEPRSHRHDSIVESPESEASVQILELEAHVQAGLAAMWAIPFLPSELQVLQQAGIQQPQPPLQTGFNNGYNVNLYEGYAPAAPYGQQAPVQQLVYGYGNGNWAPQGSNYVANLTGDEYQATALDQSLSGNYYQPEERTQKKKKKKKKGRPLGSKDTQKRNAKGEGLAKKPKHNRPGRPTNEQRLACQELINLQAKINEINANGGLVSMEQLQRLEELKTKSNAWKGSKQKKPE